MNDQIDSGIETLIDQHRRMAERLARRYSHGSEVDPDLRQVADLGLFLAASRYRPEAGPFRPFALATIVGELKKYLRSNGWAVKVPRGLQEASITVDKAVERLEQQLRRSPTPGELAIETGLTEERVLSAIQARNARFVSEPPAVDQPTSEVTEIVDTSLDMRKAAATLQEASQYLLKLRFTDELTQREIAGRLEISQSQVHRRLAAALNELRSAVDGVSEHKV